MPANKLFGKDICIVATTEAIGGTVGSFVTFGGINAQKKSYFKQLLTVDGNLNFTGNLLQNGTVYVGTSKWGANGLDIYFPNGQVGIGNTAPNYTLDVNGSLNFNGDLYQNGARYVGSQWTSSTDGRGVISYTSGDVIISSGLTTGNLNLTGSIFQNGSPYIASQWTTTSGSAISYTGGDVIISGLTAGNINFTGDLYKNGEIYISSQWTTTSGNTISYTGGNVIIGGGLTSGNLNLTGSLSVGVSNIMSGSFAASNNVTVEENVTGLVFDSNNVVSFTVNMSVVVERNTTNLYENFILEGSVSSISGWKFYVTSSGDVSGIVFSITTNGQVQYTSSNTANWSSTTMRFYVNQITKNTGNISSLATVGNVVIDSITLNSATDSVLGTSNGGLNVVGGATIGKSVNIRSTTDVTGLGTGGALTVFGGLSVSKNMLVGGALTAGNITATDINFTGNLYQNGVIFSGGGGGLGSNSTVSNLVTTTLTAGALTATSLTAGALTATTLTVGNLTVPGTLTVVNITSTNFVDTNITTTSLLVTNSTIQNLLISGGSLRATHNSNSVGSIFTTGGNVGIGTTAPAFTLDVVGSIDSTSMTTGILSATNAVATNSTIQNLLVSGGLRATNNTNTLGSILTSGGNMAIIGNGNNATSLNLWDIPGAAWQISTGGYDLTIRNGTFGNTLVDRLSIDINGNLKANMFFAQTISTPTWLEANIYNTWITPYSVTVPATGKYFISYAGRMALVPSGFWWKTRVFNNTTSTQLSQSFGFNGVYTGDAYLPDTTTSMTFISGTLNAGAVLYLQFWVNGSGSATYVYGGDGNGDSGITILRISS